MDIHESTQTLYNKELIDCPKNEGSNVLFYYKYNILYNN